MEDNISIYKYENQKYKELEYNLYYLNEEWRNKTMLTDYPELCGLDEDTYLCDINKAKFNPTNFDEDIDNYYVFKDKFKLTNEEPFDKNFFKTVICDNMDIFAKYIGENKSNSDINHYVDTIKVSIEIIGLLKYLYDNKIKKKFFILGPANKKEQIIPKFIFEEINKNNECYEIYVFEPCDTEGGWGCPTSKEIYEYINSNLEDKSKISNIKIFHIKNFIMDIILFMFLKVILGVYNDTTNIICNVIGTGHSLNDETIKIKKLKIFNIEECIIEGKIIWFYAVGGKLIWYDKEKRDFTCINIPLTNPCRYSPLNCINYENILNNNITSEIIKELSQEAGKYYKKYLKYKAKYLKLKKLT